MFKDRLQESEGNPKRFWGVINDLLKHKDDVNMPMLKKEDNTEFVEYEDTPEYIIEFFASVGEKLLLRALMWKPPGIRLQRLKNTKVIMSKWMSRRKM